MQFEAPTVIAVRRFFRWGMGSSQRGESMRLGVLRTHRLNNEVLAPLAWRAISKLALGPGAWVG